MTEKRTVAELAELVDQAQEQIRLVAEIQRARIELTGTGSVRNGRVTVTVNSDGTVIETTFSGAIDDLKFSEIARAVTEAAQRAVADLGRKNRELTAPLQRQRARMPKLTDLVDGIPDLRAQLGERPEPSLAAPNSPESSHGVEAASKRFTDAEPGDHGPRGGSVTESSW